jgi:hypothetical protein
MILPTSTDRGPLECRTTPQLSLALLLALCVTRCGDVRIAMPRALMSPCAGPATEKEKYDPSRPQSRAGLRSFTT